MDNTALTLIIFTNLILVIILGFLSVLIFKLFFKKNNGIDTTSKEEDKNNKYHPEIISRMKSMKDQNHISNLFCPIHHQEPGEVVCAICDQFFCKNCIKPYKTLHFCKEHLPLIMREEWKEVTTLKTSTEFPEEGVKLYEVKKMVFKEKNIPSYIETHYKINIDQDFIETYLVLYTTKENLDFFKKQI
jgi:hypothetical protein